MENTLKKEKQKAGRGTAICAVFLILLGLSVFVRNNICCIAMVEGESMYPTLKDKELYMVNRYNYRPTPGNIVLVRVNPDIVGTSHIVKRVIAVGGDTVEIDYEENKLYVNDQLLEEPYMNAEDDDPMREKGNLPDRPFTIPKGYVFVMGDNRNHSMDSRSIWIGPVAESDVIGKVTHRIR